MIDRSKIHPEYNGTFGSQPEKPKELEPGMYLGTFTGIATNFPGAIVTAAGLNDYFYDPEMRIEGNHYLKTSQGRPWTEIQRVS